MKWLETLALDSGRWRGDCPVCGGINTLSIHKEIGTVYYKCFRSSCGLLGSSKKESSYEELATQLADNSVLASLCPFIIPDHFVAVDNREDCINYLIKNNCFEAYKEKRVDIRYDPRQNRVVFLIKQDGECYGAVGRALSGAILPKWYNYDSHNNKLFLVNSPRRVLRCPRRAILVEDCASACSASRLVDSYALLGTNIVSYDLTLLLKYDMVYIALDKDASAKAIDLQRYLSYYCNSVRVALLEKDLKYCTVQEIERVLT